MTAELLRENDRLRAENAKLHEAVCRAVAILNTSPDVIATAAGRQVRDLLRIALADHADAEMDRPVHERDRAKIAAKHRRTLR